MCSRILGNSDASTKDIEGVRYRACPIYLELASIFRKTIDFTGLVGNAMSGFHDSIQLELLFGSMAVGQQNQTSDVDVMVIGDSSLLEYRIPVLAK